jgi:hypothetical protein
LTQHVNLYNPLFEKKDEPLRLRTMGIALGAIAFGLTGLYIYAAITTRSAERLTGQLAEQLAVQRDQMAKLATLPPRAPDRALETEVARLDMEVRSRVSTLHALNAGELGNTAGFSEFFAALGRGAVPGIWLTSVTIGESGNELIVHGRALRADLMPSFLRGLNSEPVMRGRKVTELRLAAKAAPRPGEAKAAEPSQGFIEFSLSAPLQLAEAGPPARLGTP